MRLDKYLKVSRLIKRRTVANEACDAEKVSVNGKPARASYDVKVNDIIEINMGKTPLKVKVVKVVEVVGKDGASELYEVLLKKSKDSLWKLWIISPTQKSWR